VAVKVRLRPFLTRSRSTPVRPPTAAAEAVEQAALDALRRFDLDRPVRLLGVRADFAAAADPPGSQSPAETSEPPEPSEP